MAMSEPSPALPSTALRSLRCMSFTGAKAAQWEEKFIAAFNAMEAELQDGRKAETHGSITKARWGMWFL